MAARGAPSKTPGRADDRELKYTIPLLEWVVAGLGVLLVGGAIVFLVYHSMTRGRTPPDLRAVAERVLELDHGYVVQFRALNEGGSTAAEVTIEARSSLPTARPSGPRRCSTICRRAPTARARCCSPRIRAGASCACGPRAMPSLDPAPWRAHGADAMPLSGSGG